MANHGQNQELLLSEACIGSLNAAAGRNGGVDDEGEPPTRRRIAGRVRGACGRLLADRDVGGGRDAVGVWAGLRDHFGAGDGRRHGCASLLLDCVSLRLAAPWWLA